MRILLLGANGQVGHALRSRLAALGEVLPATREGRLPEGGACETADLSRPESLAPLVGRLAPALVVNAAAYTAVDRAEDEAALAWRVNAEAPGELARACAARGIPLVHFSTDYVFDGTAGRPLREDDPPAPLGEYGRSKWAGEQAVRDSGAAHRIFRLCWIYDGRGHNFLLTMLRLAGERGHLRVVADQRGTPTPAGLVADAVAASLRARPGATGTWHLAAGGETTWHGFASALLQGAHARGLLARMPEVEAITSADYPTRARRPADSRLDTTRFRADFGLHLDDWQTALGRVLDTLAAGARPA